MKKVILFLTFVIFSYPIFSQSADNAGNERFTIHSQTTVINQFKPGFSAKYTGDNSLTTSYESQTSLTSTFFVGMRLWKGASVFVNPEIAGGSGLSGAMGVAASTNGETFRVGDPAPKIYLARLFFNQIFPLTTSTYTQESDANQLAGSVPEKYFSITAGKVGVADYFDDNRFSHDPRSQFMSWALMDNGAWDYPANTRGYSPSLVLEFVSPHHELRYGFSLLPKLANGPDMDWQISHSRSSTVEYAYHHNNNGREGYIRILGFLNNTHMGSYSEIVAKEPQAPSVENDRRYGRSKFGFGVSVDQDITSNLGFFLRFSYNDGKNETWAFTEIDRSLSAGFSMSGQQWHRAGDNVGLANVVSGISKDHREYLKAGGKGFMLGDGNLNYAPEDLTEFYYSAELVKDRIFLTGAYQLLVNPGYNRDRQGPVNVFSIRFHAQI